MTASPTENLDDLEAMTVPTTSWPQKPSRSQYLQCTRAISRNASLDVYTIYSQKAADLQIVCIMQSNPKSYGNLHPIAALSLRYRLTKPELVRTGGHEAVLLLEVRHVRAAD